MEVHHSVASSDAWPTSATAQMPVVNYLALEDGPPHLVSGVCLTCEALYFDRRNACARCFGTEFGFRPLQNTGTVTAFTIVQRAAPGMRAPYMSVIVDLDGGGVVKANFLGEPAADAISAGTRVVLDTFVAKVDDNGVEAIAFGYRMEDAA